MRGQYVQITKIRYLCFDFVHSRYTRMTGFGRREIELMQALCIYDIYIEYYSVYLVHKERQGGSTKPLRWQKKIREVVRYLF